MASFNFHIELQLTGDQLRLALVVLHYLLSTGFALAIGIKVMAQRFPGGLTAKLTDLSGSAAGISILMALR